MYIRLAIVLLAAAGVILIARRSKPSLFGLVFGLLLLYVPFMGRLPLDLASGINGLTGFLIALTLLGLNNSDPARPRSSMFRNLVLCYLALSLAGFATSLSAGSNSDDLLVLFKRWLDPPLFGLLALLLVRDGDRKFIVACTAVGYALVSIQALREGFDYGLLKRAPGLLGQPNETGAFLAMYVPLLLAIALFLSGRGLRIALLGVVFLAGWGLVFLESRAALIGYAIGVLLTLLASKRPRLAASGLVFALLIYALPDVLPQRVITRFESTLVSEKEEYITQDSGELEGALEPSAAGRIIQWKAGLNAMSGNPMGFGFNRFTQVIGQYGGIRGMDAHNIFLLVGVELGIVALLLVIALFIKMAADAWSVANSHADPFLAAVGTGVFVMVIVAAFVNSFGSRLMQDQPSTYFWVLTGMTARARDLLRMDAPAKTPLSKPELQQLRWQR